MATTLTNTDGTFLDQDCTIDHNGMKFTSGGAFIGMDKAGKMGGILYTRDKERTIGNWTGTIQIPVSFGRVFRSNMGDRRRAVYFRYNGRNFYGMQYNIDWNESVSVREVK